MTDKMQILHLIATVAKKLGRAPSLTEFVSRTGISRYSFSKCFAKWNDAVRAAGLQPSSLYVRPENGELLEDWGRTVRERRGLASRRGYQLQGKYEARTLERRFEGWNSVPEAFRNFAKGKPEWADVVALLTAGAENQECEGPKEAASRPLVPGKARGAALKGRATYGNPIHLTGFAHEPVNEQGVVLLFGMLARELGYRIEAVQKGFPDCEAKRQIDPERWQRVNIEFEYESKNFREHGHSFRGCDVIVCWRHNWPECPKSIDVLELCSVIKSLTNS